MTLAIGPVLIRLVEQADYVATKELFGDVGGVDLERFLPKSVKDFDEYAATIAQRYVVGHRECKNYKAFIKSLVKHICEPLPSVECKDIETSIAGVRSGKHATLFSPCKRGDTSSG